MFKFLLAATRILQSSGPSQTTNLSRGISLLSVLCFCQRRKSRLAQSRAYFDLQEETTPSSTEAWTRSATEGENGYNDACRTVRRTRFRRDCSAAFTFDLSALYLQQITRISPPFLLYDALPLHLHRFAYVIDLATRFPDCVFVLWLCQH